jgi:hypothetical protein
MLRKCAPSNLLKEISEAQAFLDSVPAVRDEFIFIVYCHENEFDNIFKLFGAVDDTIPRPSHLKHFNDCQTGRRT